MASIIERLGSGCASNPMRVLIRLTAPSGNTSGAVGCPQKAYSFRFGGRSATERGTQTLQRLIRVPQLARDSIVVLADPR